MLENKEAHLHALRDIFGKERVLHEPVDCFGYSYDASPEALNPDETPDFVCKAHSTAEVSALMKYANAHKIPVVCRGTGSGRSGGVIPVRGGIVLMVDEMNQIVELDPARSARCTDKRSPRLLRGPQSLLSTRTIFLQIFHHWRQHC